MDEEGGRVGVKGMNGWTEGQKWSGQKDKNGVDRINPRDQFMQNQLLRDQLSLEIKCFE